MITTVTMNASVDKLYLVEQIEPGTVMRVQSCNNTAGGKGVNVSRVAALLGERVLATGIVGGHAGRYIEDLLRANDIQSDFAQAPIETRCCINIRDLATGRHTELLEPGAKVDADVLDAFYQKYQSATRQSTVVAISGSMPTGTPEDYYAKLVAHARTQGKKAIVDTSGNALKHCLAAKPTMIKPNIDEIRQILQVDTASRADVIAAAKRIHSEGIEIVAVSLGRDGVLVAHESGVYQGITPDIPVVNTVGCGDSMVAGFAVGLSREENISDTIRLAVAVSTANALCMETASFRQADLNAILPQVRVEKLGA